MDFSNKYYFVTGTDTGIGKTYVTQHFMQTLKAKGKTVLGLKPIACGGQHNQNEDALIYLKENSLSLSYSTINPFYFNEAISPHIAAQRNHAVLHSNDIVYSMQEALNQDVDHIFIEGAGGVCVPISEQETMLDLMRAFDVPVILVVGLRLGCLNHTLLSVKALESAGLTIAGWVPNLIDPTMECVEENIRTLERNFSTIYKIS